MSAQKALQGSKTETRELLGGTEENSVSPTKGSLICPPGISAQRPSRALDLPRALLPELQRYKDTVRGAVLGEEVSTTTDANLDSAFVENALFLTDP